MHTSCSRFSIMALAACASCLFIAGSVTLADPTEEQPRLLKIGKVPAIKLRPRPQLTAERKAEIKRWIDQLAEIDQPGFGYSWQLTGCVFAPQPPSAQARISNHDDEDLKNCPAVLHLVEAGPDAIPYLLEKLDDATPTELKFEHSGSWGGMWHDIEMLTNPANKREIRPAINHVASNFGIKQYTVKRGDVCFAILGQITGRCYQAVRYQNTGCVVINSPVESKDLCDAARKNWSSDDPRKKLLQNLLFDYATEKASNEPNAKALYRASFFKVEAARRLAYYYPEETSDLLVKRINALDLRRVTEPPVVELADEAAEDDSEIRSPALIAFGYYLARASELISRTGKGTPENETIDQLSKEALALTARSMRNGAQTDELLKALTGAKSPGVQRALLKAAHRTDDPELFSALLTSTIKSDKAFTTAKILEFIEALLPPQDFHYHEGYELLSALVQIGGAPAKQGVESYLKDANPHRRQMICRVFEDNRPDWGSDLFLPMLDDLRVVNGLRNCDAAARALATMRDDLKFDETAPREERDKSIAAIKAMLKASRPRASN